MPTSTRDDRRPESDEADGERGVTRRSVLVGSAATFGAGAVGVGGLAGASGVADAQEITQAGVVPDVPEWEGVDYTGLLIHVGATSPVEASVADDCDVPAQQGWPPATTFVYEATLINHKQPDVPEVGTNLHIAESATVVPGQLYIVNRAERCSDGFVGVSLEQIGQTGLEAVAGPVETDDVAADRRQTTEPPTGAVGPGLGPVASITALLAGGALVDRHGDDGN